MRRLHSYVCLNNILRHANTGIKLACCLTLLSTGPAFTQTLAAEATAEKASTTPAAWVYVQEAKGVNLYDAASSGKLSLVKGSPFETEGAMAGSNGSHLFTTTETSINSYTVESDGAIGKLASTTEIGKYTPSSCGFVATSGTLLDHTGKYLYVNAVSVNGYTTACVLWQSYKIASNGELTYLGDLSKDAGYITTISSDDIHAYGVNGQSQGPCSFGGNHFAGYTRTSGGVLELNESFKNTDPKPNPSPAGSNNDYFPFAVASDPAGHLAVLMSECDSTEQSQPLAKYLASYTINRKTGAITATTSYKNMPLTEVDNDIPLNSLPPMIMRMSLSGKYLAVAGGGIQVFHFNGSEPITPLSELLQPGDDFERLQWDNDNHLYALNYWTGEFFEYAVTSTGVTLLNSLPTTPFNAQGLVVVSK
jgi:hypothetical protein